MKKIAVGLVLALSIMGCRAQVKVQAGTKQPPPEPPKQEQPAPAPPPEEPKQGEQIVLPELIEFEFDQAKIKETPKTQEALEKLADVMKKHPNITKLRIEGHTDNVGTKKHNDKLSKARAQAVAKWLAQHEVEEKRLAFVGFGSKRPLVANDSDAHRAQNRRTEYYVEEIDGKKVDDGKDANAKGGAKVASGTTTGGKTSQ
jgi:OmpA-OmpF porin, OOP family